MAAYMVAPPLGVAAMGAALLLVGELD